MTLDGRVAIVTGAGRGLGREHALRLASRGAAVVVNDTGGTSTGEGSDVSIAHAVAAEIRDAGGRAAASTDDVSTMDGARAAVATALETFGELHVLVNNAGIVRDDWLLDITEDDWDALMRVHLRGHFCTTQTAGIYWRGHRPDDALIVNTSSAAGLLSWPGLAGYAAAKAGIAAFTVAAAKELSRYGVRVNAIAPYARTRLTERQRGLEAAVLEPSEGFDAWHPANVSRLVAALAEPGCALTGAVLHVFGGQLGIFRGWTLDVLTDVERPLDEEEIAPMLESAGRTQVFSDADLGRTLRIG